MLLHSRRFNHAPRRLNALRRFFHGLCAAILWAVLASHAHAQGTKWALLVGVDEYENPGITRLNYAVADVKAVGSSLRVHAGFPEDNVSVMTSDIKRGSTRPTHINVIKRLSELATKVKPEDTFVFYFAGHGYMMGGKNQFLGTVNADTFDLDCLQVTTLPLDLLREKMKRIKARQVIFIIDACRNDPARKSMYGPIWTVRRYAGPSSMLLLRRFAFCWTAARIFMRLLLWNAPFIAANRGLSVSFSNTARV